MMLPQGNRESNITRFTGFAEEYDQYRPEPPTALLSLLSDYIGGRPQLVADIGCGTGLSSFIWQSRADRVIGVEPNDDMRSVAERKRERLADSTGTRFDFVSGYSNSLPFLASGSVDLVTCSQSFHWMEPASTLAEAARVLRSGGVFAAYDCDWPPVVGSWELETAYLRVSELSDAVISREITPQQAADKRDKEQHLSHIRTCGHFRYSSELILHHSQPIDADRYVGLALSQGSYRTVRKLGGSPQVDEAVREFRELAEHVFQSSRSREVRFGYRVRFGVK